MSGWLRRSNPEFFPVRNLSRENLPGGSQIAQLRHGSARLSKIERGRRRWAGSWLLPPAGGRANAADATSPEVLNAYVRIAPDNVVTLYSISPEIGQGIKTAFGLMIAEDLDADWKSVRVEQARISPLIYGDQQRAGGSTSVRRNWNVLRQAGASARAMLVAAAAKEWNVPAGDITTENSTVMHRASGKSLTYGALAEKAAKIPVPDTASLKLKDRKEWRLLGKRYTGVDNKKVVTGQPLFGIDVHSAWDALCQFHQMSCMRRQG